jgi:hypothetical protein
MVLYIVFSLYVFTQQLGRKKILKCMIASIPQI